MKETDVRDIAVRGLYEREPIRGKVEETHISWVIISRKVAFKIKKPLKLDFLDFSTLALRKELCEKEVKLNRRFSRIYLGALPVRRIGNEWLFGGPEDSHVVDYCVAMKRMATSKRLDIALQKANVKENSMNALATEVASFHNKAQQIFTPFDLAIAKNTFNEIESISELASSHIDKQFGLIISQAVEWSNSFLEKHAARIQQRIDQGLKRDVHGDLHCANIFLYKEPVLFDCIEFNDSFRQIDVLYEIAFLCMDLERYHHKYLSDIFVGEYGRHFPAFQNNEDHRLFVYFKTLRANVRAKVHAIQCAQAENETEFTHHLAETRKYLTLLDQYRVSIQS